MATYNNYYPYNPYYSQPYQTTNSQMQQPIQPQQIHNGGYVSVRSEDEARMYPVAPGNSVTFINELAPFQYKKTMGFSQFDKPIFEVFEVIPKKPSASEETKEPTKDIEYALKTDLTAIFATIDTLKGDIDNLNEKIGTFETKKAKPRKEDDE